MSAAAMARCGASWASWSTIARILPYPGRGPGHQRGGWRRSASSRAGLAPGAGARKRGRVPAGAGQGASRDALITIWPESSATSRVSARSALSLRSLHMERHGKLVLLLIVLAAIAVGGWLAFGGAGAGGGTPMDAPVAGASEQPTGAMVAAMSGQGKAGTEAAGPERQTVAVAGARP